MTWSEPGSKWSIFSARVSQAHPLLNSTRAPKRQASIDETHAIGSSEPVPGLYHPAGGSCLSAFAALSGEFHLPSAPWDQRQSAILQVHTRAAKKSFACQHYCWSLPDDLLSGSTDPAQRIGSSSGTGSGCGTIDRHPSRSPGSSRIGC